MNIINGDSYQRIKIIKDNSVDLILTDPPYNISQYQIREINISGRKNINKSMEDWDNKKLDVKYFAKEFRRVLKPTGNIFVFCSYDQFGEWIKVFNELMDKTQFMVWHKTNPSPHFMKVSFLNSIELIACGWNKGHTWNFGKQNEMHNFIESAIVQGDVRFHSTQKPVSILEKIIKLASNENDLVFDPFMGSGSTGVASLNLDRKFLGIEKDTIYFTKSKKRLNRVKNIIKQRNRL